MPALNQEMLMNLLFLCIVAFLIFFMYRNSRKRQKDQRSLQEKIVSGARVMTNSGIFGTIVSLTNDSDEVTLETTPGTVLTVHKQSIGRVVEEAASDVKTENADNSVEAEPEFGERTHTVETNTQDKPE